MNFFLTTRYLTEDLGCSLLSVSHRLKQLQNFHHFVLRFDGMGDCSFEAIGNDSVVV